MTDCKIFTVSCSYTSLYAFLFSLFAFLKSNIVFSFVHLSNMHQNYILLFRLAALLLFSPLKICHGSVSESEFLPFRESDGNSRFRFGDDNAKQVALSTPFKLFNHTYWHTHIGGNGLLSFGVGNNSTLNY